MKATYCRSLAIVLVLGLLAPDTARAQQTPPTFSTKKVQQSFGSGTNRVDLLADRAEYDWDSNWVTFLGNVVIRSNGNELRGERVRFNTQTKAAQAVGRVTLLGANGEMWTGNALDVDMTDPKAPAVESGDMIAYYAPYRIEAERGGLREGAYYAEDVTFTTCTNTPGHRHYEVWAHDAVVVPDDDLTAHGAVPYLFGIPFFYWPYFWKDLHNHYGFRFEPGYQSRWGAYLLTIYKMRVWRADDDNWVDSRTHLDLRSKRGFAYGETVNWYSTDIGDGWITGYGLNDRYKEKKLKRDGIDDRARYRFRLNHDLPVTDLDRILVQGVYLSDRRMLHDFFEDEYAEMPQPENYVTYTRTADDYLAGLSANFRLNDFYTQVERLPEAWFNVNQRELGETGFYYDSETSATYLRKVFQETKAASKDEDYDVGRFDTLHALSYPLKIAGFLSVVPTVSWRGTYFSKTREQIHEDRVSMFTVTNGTGEVFSYPVTNNVARNIEDDADFRSVGRFDVETSFKMYGMWTTEDGVPWRHVVEPYANYTYVPEPNLVPEDLYPFDAIDEIDFQHTVRLGLRNRWQTKDPVVAGDGEVQYKTMREFLVLDTYADVRIEPEEDEETIEALHLDTDFRPAPWFRFKNEFSYDMDEDELSKITSLLQIRHPIVRSTAEYTYRADASDLIAGELVWKLTSIWEIAGFGRYDFEDGQVEKVGAYLQWNFDCIGIRIMGSVFPGYTRTDGVREEDDYRVTLSLWEMHFPPNNLYKNHY